MQKNHMNHQCENAVLDFRFKFNSGISMQITLAQKCNQVTDELQLEFPFS